MKEGLSSRYVKLSDRQVGLTKATDALLVSGNVNLANLNTATERLANESQQFKNEFKEIYEKLHQCLSLNADFRQLQYGGQRISNADLIFLATCGLGDPDKEKRINSLRLIGDLSPSSQALSGNVIASVYDIEPRVKGAAIRTLGMLGEKYVAMLVAKLEHEGCYLEGNVSGDLKRLGASLSPIYIYSLKDENLITRKNASSNLSFLEKLPKESETALLKALEDEDSDVRSRSVKALVKVEGLSNKALTAIIRFMQMSVEEELSAAIKALVDVGKKHSKFKAEIIDALDRRGRKEVGRYFSAFTRAIGELR